MHWAALITVIVLIEYFVFQGLVGAARQKAGIPAPKVVGDEHYERWYRVQLNTVEQFVIFLPALWLCAYFQATTFVLVGGLAFAVARPIYAVSYVADPTKRTIGFVLGWLANLALLLRAAWSAVLLALF